MSEHEAPDAQVEVRENQEVDPLQPLEPLSPELVAELNRASDPFVGRWNQLVSTTNWEKGRIILQWREQLKESGAPASEFTDEAWAMRVGGLTGQHAGRLRRVYRRFGSSYDSYDGLFWSHFHAAVDWDDAEMWLEGAVQNSWSVSKMRGARWDTLGRTGAVPADDDIVRSELDEDFEQSSHTRPATEGDYQGARPEGPDFGDEPAGDAVDGEVDFVGPAVDVDVDRVERVQPFEDLPELPDDLNDAFDSFKLAILRHKGNNWSEIACSDVLACLDSLKQLAVAPSD